MNMTIKIGKAIFSKINTGATGLSISSNDIFND